MTFIDAHGISLAANAAYISGEFSIVEHISITQRTMTTLKTPKIDTILWNCTLRRFGFQQFARL